MKLTDRARDGNRRGPSFFTGPLFEREVFIKKNRLVISPDGFSIKMVGARGFEPPTSCSQSRHSARLSYAPFS